MSENQRLARRVVIGILVAYGIIFVLLNSDEIELNFIFFSTRASLLVALLLIGALGFAIGFFAHITYNRKSGQDD